VAGQVEVELLAAELESVACVAGIALVIILVHPYRWGVLEIDLLAYRSTPSPAKNVSWVMPRCMV
jgi:hypothetical protein